MNYLVILQLCNLGCRARAGGSVTANPDSPTPSSPSAPEVTSFIIDMTIVLPMHIIRVVYSLCAHGVYVELCWLMQAATQVMVHVTGTIYVVRTSRPISGSFLLYYVTGSSKTLVTLQHVAILLVMIFVKVGKSKSWFLYRDDRNLFELSPENP